MKEFIVEIYELHASKRLVKADSRAEAIRKVVEDGAGEEIDSPEYIEVIDHKSYSDLEYQYPGIVGELEKVYGEGIDSGSTTFIRSVEEA